MNTIRVGIIGAGRIGKIHAESIATRIPNAELAAIATVVISSYFSMTLEKPWEPQARCCWTVQLRYTHPPIHYSE